MNKIEKTSLLSKALLKATNYKSKFPRLNTLLGDEGFVVDIKDPNIIGINGVVCQDKKQPYGLYIAERCDKDEADYFMIDNEPYGWNSYFKKIPLNSIMDKVQLRLKEREIDATREYSRNFILEPERYSNVHLMHVRAFLNDEVYEKLSKDNGGEDFAKVHNIFKYPHRDHPTLRIDSNRRIRLWYTENHCKFTPWPDIRYEYKAYEIEFILNSKNEWKMVSKKDAGYVLG